MWEKSDKIVRITPLGAALVLLIMVFPVTPSFALEIYYGPPFECIGVADSTAAHFLPKTQQRELGEQPGKKRKTSWRVPWSYPLPGLSNARSWPRPR